METQVQMVVRQIPVRQNMTQEVSDVEEIAIPVPQVMTQEVLVSVAVPKTLDFQRSRDGTETGPVGSESSEDCEMPVVQFLDRYVDMPVVTQRQVPMVPNAVEVPRSSTLTRL